MGDFFEGTETTESFEGGDGNGHFGLVVVVRVIFGVFGMELLGEFLVRVGLDGESFCDGEDFEEEGEFFIVFLGDFTAHECLVIANEVEE